MSDCTGNAVTNTPGSLSKSFYAAHRIGDAGSRRQRLFDPWRSRSPSGDHRRSILPAEDRVQQWVWATTRWQARRHLRKPASDDHMSVASGAVQLRKAQDGQPYVIPNADVGRGRPLRPYMTSNADVGCGRPLRSLFRGRRASVIGLAATLLVSTPGQHVDVYTVTHYSFFLAGAPCVATRLCTTPVMTLSWNGWKGRTRQTRTA